MPTRIPRIKEFPKDGRVWRIDWLGAVHRTAAEVLIDVVLSPVIDGVTQPRKQDHFDSESPQKIGIGVGQLPFLSIGSLWCDGRRLKQAAGFPKELVGVDIGRSQVKLIDAGTVLSEAPDKRWLIPKFSHRLPMSVWPSRCFAIEYNGDPYGIVLPVTEAIRFYYAVSTDLAHITFNGSIQHNLNSIIDTDVSGLLADSSRMVLRLRQWLADDDGWVIGRVLANQDAREGIMRVYDSLMKSSANSAATFPECGLPFVGRTQWSTRGVELPGEKGGPKRWLIHELTWCTAPFPFEDLEVMRDNDGRQGDPSADIPDEEKKPAWTRPKKTASLEPEAELQSDEPPEKATEVVDIPLASDRFAALKGKKVIKTDKAQCKYKGSSFRESQITAVLGTGEAGWTETGVTPLNVTWQREVERRASLPASFETVLQIVDALNEMPGIKAKVRSPGASTEFLPLTEASRKRQWAYLDSSRHTRRHVLIVDIDCDGRVGCLVEYERREGEKSRAALLISRDFVQISDERFRPLLSQLSHVKGVWLNLKSRMLDMQMELFNHSRKSAKNFAEDICVALKGVLGT